MADNNKHIYKNYKIYLVVPDRKIVLAKVKKAKKAKKSPKKKNIQKEIAALFLNAVSIFQKS